MQSVLLEKIEDRRHNEDKGSEERENMKKP